MSFGSHNDLRVELYNSYMEYIIKRYKMTGINSISGICLGASLQWASDVLGEIAGNNKTMGFSIPNKQRFFDAGNLNQKALEFLYDLDKKNIKKNIVDILNRQENHLKKASKYKIDYSLKNGLSAEKKVNAMLGGDKSYKNSAFILSAYLQKYSDKNHSYSHAVAILNYEGKVFLFNTNKGVCKLPCDGSISCKVLLRSIAESCGIDKYFIPFYILHTSNQHIFMKLQTSKKTNKNIVTREVYPSSQA